MYVNFDETCFSIVQYTPENSPQWAGAKSKKRLLYYFVGFLKMNSFSIYTMNIKKYFWVEKAEKRIFGNFGAL